MLWLQVDAFIPGGGGVLPIKKVVGVPVGNFHDKPYDIPVNFSSTTFEPLKEILCFESTSHTQKRGKITENKVRESLKCLCA